MLFRAAGIAIRGIDLPPSRLQISVFSALLPFEARSRGMIFRQFSRQFSTRHKTQEQHIRDELAKISYHKQAILDKKQQINDLNLSIVMHQCFQ